MSRQPPLPSGLPPKPRFSGPPPPGDSYRPGVPQNENYYAQRDRDRDHRERDRDRQPMYQFGSNNDHGYSRRSPPRYDSYAPGTAPPLRPSGDIYRPQQQGGQGGGSASQGFTFRYDAPPNIIPHPSNDFRPRSPLRRNYENSNPRRQGQGGYGPGTTRGAYRGNRAPRMASDRDFLKGNRAPTPELMPGMDEEDGGVVRYKPIEDVSDSEEAEMDMSDDTNFDQPTKKHRTESKAPDADAAPKWSNPDPYTTLPPPDESQRKKKDVVKLIRKARVETGSGTVKAQAETDDFISFDFDNEDEDRGDQPGQGVAGAPKGPRYSHRDNLHPAAPSAPTSITQAPQIRAQNRPKLDTASDPALGSRKRNLRDELKPAPLLHKVRQGKIGKANGQILNDWKVNTKSSGTPWLQTDHSDTVNMGIWLHKEIFDFYHYVKPRQFEDLVRTKLVEDLRMRVQENFQGTDIYTFGSFPAGLYLPTADMDLVCVSDAYMSRGQHMIGHTNLSIRRFGEFIKRQKLAIEGSIDLILGARVPLVKYIDKITGIRVDISFENKTGLVANKTFRDWKAEFPAMPVLVTLIKHLLAMRGLNEPVNGGIGGFSITCLVVSLLQNMPQVQSRSMTPEHNLGEILMEFFDLYGNQFNVTTTAIQFDPPGYVSKASVRPGIYKAGNSGRLSILDPNNPGNDISGGSGNTTTVLKFFSQAYLDLQKRMGDLQYSKDRKNQSILSCILTGNYSSFELQREHLRHVHEIRFGPVDEI